jgi:ABC-type nitrate/sulfonate/bicarbonate transport system substrate-binding protein
MAATLKIALVSRTIFYAPVWVAEQNGYFRDEGVDARFEIFDNAEKINAAMHAGQAQIAIASVEALVADSFKGGKYRIVASVAQKPPHFIIAQPGIKTVQELRGKRFGVLSLHEGTTYFVQDIETAIGFKRGDIIIDAVGGAPTRWKLLREGKIDAGLQPFPLSYESEAAGFSNLGPISKYVPDYEFTAVFLDPAWGNANKPAVTGFLRALRRGQAAMAADPDKAAAVLVRELSTTPDYARRAIGDALKFKLMPDGLAASAAGMRRVFDTLQRAGLVPNDQPFDIGRFVDASYLAAAR